MTVMAPADESELASMLRTAIEHNGPAALRYPRAEIPARSVPGEMKLLDIGRGELLKEGKDLCIVAAGHILAEARKAVDILDGNGVHAALINARFIKPLDRDLILEWASETGRVISLEENAVIGGLGSAVLELLSENEMLVPVLTMGLPDRFVDHGTRDELTRELGLDGESVAFRIRDWLNRAGGVVVYLTG